MCHRHPSLEESVGDGDRVGGLPGEVLLLLAEPEDATRDGQGQDEA